MLICTLSASDQSTSAGHRQSPPADRNIIAVRIAISADRGLPAVRPESHITAADVDVAGRSITSDKCPAVDSHNSQMTALDYHRTALLVLVSADRRIIIRMLIHVQFPAAADRQFRIPIYIDD